MMSSQGPEEAFDEVAPDASAMVESMRAHGYTLPTAIADLIDNSIDARCKNVWLNFEWDRENSWISITDDGHGMGEQELVQAMRLGSRNPLEERHSNDLGRFGLGLKTASFSQARRLTVISRSRAAEIHLRRWDLDHLARPDVKGWQLLRSAHPESKDRQHLLERLELPQGTQVLLEVPDRVIGVASRKETERDREDHFLWQIERVREHIEMVFHRFLARGSLRIHLNGRPVSAWDPFLVDHAATQNLGEYEMRLGDHTKSIRVTAYVMPHRDRFSGADEHRRAGGPEGWNAQQGFYLYRERRLIIAGDWLQLGWQKEEHFKLARIRLDIPNSMDHDWQIDVKKSTAAPPRPLREELKCIAQEVRKAAKEVYSHRGKYYSKGKKDDGVQRRPWRTVTGRDGEFRYRIDRDHPVLQPLIRSLSEAGREELETLLRLVEETVPVQRIWIDTAENQEGAASPFEGEKSSQLRRIILLCHQALLRQGDTTSEQAWDSLLRFEPFLGKEAQAIISQLREES